MKISVKSFRDSFLVWWNIYLQYMWQWSRCTGSQPAVVGWHYFPPGLRSPSQLKNVTVFWPVPRCTGWWQRHIGVNNLPKVVTVHRWCTGVVVQCWTCKLQTSGRGFKSYRGKAVLQPWASCSHLYSCDTKLYVIRLWFISLLLAFFALL